MLKFLLPASLVLLGACMHHTAAPTAANAAPPAASARANLINATGRTIGTANFEQAPQGVLIRLEINAAGLTPGWHGLHLHAKGDCSDTSAFQKSGGHHGLTEGGHGLLNATGPEAGDLPNLWAARDGSAGYEAFSTLFELAPSLDADGLAIIIHASPDDHKTQPIGGAGARIACGVIEAVPR